MSRQRRSGQVLVFMALAIVVLAGMLGLVIDAGNAQNQKQISQSAADGAALAAAYTLQSSAIATQAQATTAGKLVVTRDGLNSSGATFTYLQGNDSSVASTAANTVYVRVTVSFATNTYFLRVLKNAVNSFTLSSTAEAGPISPTRPGACVACFLTTSAPGLLLHSNAAVLTVNGGNLWVNTPDSSGEGGGDKAVQLAGSTDKVITNGGFNNYVVGSVSKANGSTTTPTFITANTILDPNAATPSMTTSGLSSKTYGNNATTLAPGYYLSGFTINSGKTVTMSAGNYLFTGPITLNGTLTSAGAGVTIFFGCSSTGHNGGVVSCPDGGEDGGRVSCSGGGGGDEGNGGNTSGGSLTIPTSGASGSLLLSPPSSGTYKGLTVFSDPNNTCTNSLDLDTTTTITGTWYTPNMPFVTTDSNSGSGGEDKAINLGNFIGLSMELSTDTALTITYDAAHSYSPPGGAAPLARLTLST